MSSCTEIRAEILDKLDTPLLLESSALLQNHLKSCEECSNFLKELLLIQKSIKDLPKFETSMNFEEKLKKQLEQETKGKTISFNAHTRRMAWTKIFAYTAGVAMMALGFVALQQNGEDGKENFSPFMNNQVVATEQVAVEPQLVAQQSKDDSVKSATDKADSLKEFKVHSNIDDKIYRVDYSE